MARPRKPLSQGARPTETREPKVTEKPRITFSFEHFVDADNTGQSLRTWAEGNSKLLLSLLEKMVHISKRDSAAVAQDSAFTLYGTYPTSKQTDFICPPGLESKKWGVIRNIGGQKSRVAGFLENNVLHIVFLDAEHKFWKSKA